MIFAAQNSENIWVTIGSEREGRGRTYGAGKKASLIGSARGDEDQRFQQLALP